tara:strand:- start:702 stop:917 length:216 start_codon:yes stop_codon:yes gene_type:complete
LLKTDAIESASLVCAKKKKKRNPGKNNITPACTPELKPYIKAASNTYLKSFLIDHLSKKYKLKIRKKTFIV